MRVNRLPFFTLVLVLFVSVSNVFGTTLEETFKKRLPFNEGGYLKLENMNGSVEVSSWDNEEVEIVAYKKVRAEDREMARHMMDRLEIKIEASEDAIEITTEHPRSSNGGWFSAIFGGGGTSYSVSYELRVPRKVELNLKSTNGRVEVSDVEGRIKLKTTNGKIIADDISGQARCRTTNGSIRAYLKDVDDENDMDFSTTNGSIKVYLPEDYSAEIDCSTTNGSVQTDFRLDDSRRHSKRRLSGIINGGDGKLDCSTTNGSIHILMND